MGDPPQNFSTHIICTRSWHLPILSMTSSLPQLLPGFPATSPLPRKVLTLLQSLTKSHLFCEGFPNYLKTIEFPLLLQTQGSPTCLWHTLMALGFTSYRHPLNKGAGSQGQALRSYLHCQVPISQQVTENTHVYGMQSRLTRRWRDDSITNITIPKPKEKCSNSVWH